ncbi:hypothetical protein GCM10027517_01870 [Phycicoccus ginsengisoli]
MVLELAAVSDPHPWTYVGAATDDAVGAHLRLLTHLGEVPDQGVLTDAGAVGDVCRVVDHRHATMVGGGLLATGANRVMLEW